MPVNTTHPEYDANLPTWWRAPDVIAGEDSIEAGGEKYLPRLDSQTDAEFAAYGQGLKTSPSRSRMSKC